MRFFLAGLVLMLLAVLTLNTVVDPFGFTNKFKTEVLAHNPNGCLIDRALIPEGAQVKFRKYLAELYNPSVVIVGSSRVAKIRSSSFGDKRFVNFTLPDVGPDSYLGITKLLKKLPNLKTVYIGVEFYAFGDQSSFYKLANRFLSYPFAKKLFLDFYRLRGSPLFPNYFSKTTDFLSSYLSWQATRRSLSLLMRDKNGLGIYEIALPNKSLVASGCLLSTTTSVNNDGAWDPRDGSEYTKAELAGEKRVSDFSEYNPQLFDGTDSTSHWHLFVNFRNLSNAKLAVLEEMLAEFQKNGIKVIGFTSPFPNRVVSLWNGLGFMRLSSEFDSKAAQIFARHEGVYYPMFVSDKLGCDDNLDYDDVWHPGTECSAEAIKQMAGGT